MNAFMESGTFPGILKIAKVTPIFKKGDPQIFDNYRPISILPIFGKIFEKLIYIAAFMTFLSHKMLSMTNNLVLGRIIQLPMQTTLSII